MAVGAAGTRVLRDMLARGLRLAVLGIASGLLVALVATRALSAMVFEVAPHDPLTFIVVAVSHHTISRKGLATARWPAESGSGDQHRPRPAGLRLPGHGPGLVGLIPPWAKDKKIRYRTINARAETVVEKPAYRIRQVHRTEVL